MVLKVNRFEVVDVGTHSGFSVGINDHAEDKIIVLIKYTDDKNINVSLAEKLISEIEDYIVNQDETTEEP